MVQANAIRTHCSSWLLPWSLSGFLPLRRPNYNGNAPSAAILQPSRADFSCTWPNTPQIYILFHTSTPYLSFRLTSYVLKGVWWLIGFGPCKTLEHFRTPPHTELRAKADDACRLWEQHYFAEAFSASLVTTVELVLASVSPAGAAPAILQSLALLEAAGASCAAASLAVRLMPSVTDANARACSAPVDAVVLAAVRGRQASLAASGQLTAALGVLSRAGWQLRAPPYPGSTCGSASALAVEIVSNYRCCGLNPPLTLLCTSQQRQAVATTRCSSSVPFSSAKSACCLLCSI